MALKILLAEDEEALSRVYKAALEHQGYEVDQAFNGQEAVDLAAQNAYQVIIMDIMMPIKTGIEALKEIRSSGDRTHVIMLTAMAEIDDRVTGLDAGADDYLTKPISLKELLARLRSLERRVSETFTSKILTLGSLGPRGTRVGSWERYSTFKQRDQVNGPLYAQSCQEINH